MEALTATNFKFPQQTKIYNGKVRDVYFVGDKIVMIATDRISAFDVILPKGIPYKGQILNQIASIFLDATADICPNWKLASPDPMVTIGVACKGFPVEMIVRGYLCGSAWRAYKNGVREICGVRLPEGMRENQKFSSPIITPTTKAEIGEHDADISKDEIIAKGLVSAEEYAILERYTLALFQRGTEIAAQRGLILVDTKYEFGTYNGTIYLMDEIHTPDSSRYFYAKGYEERFAKGEPQKQLSKEFVREWLMNNGFQGNKGEQIPEMTDEIVEGISNRYIELFEQITGKKFQKSNSSEKPEQRIELNILNFFNQTTKSMAISYEKAGVNLEAGYEVVRRIKKHVASTARIGAMGNIGAFGGMFDLSALNIKEPVLVSGTDGVGTKLKLAFAMDKHDTIGIDAVAMCVNDVLAQGAEPLYFLDYVAVGKNEPVKIEQIVAGVAEGCRQAGCALIGGETAEMPSMYESGEYDIAGFTCGVVEKSKLIDGSKVKVGDVLIGIASSGVHSNGFSLVRKIFSDANLDLFTRYTDLDTEKTLGEVALTPTKIYIKPVLEVVSNCDVHGIAHITGGGFDENIPRILKEGQGIEIKEGSWDILPIFRFLERHGNIAHREMFNIFNMGIGMVVALDGNEAEKAIALLTKHGEKATIIGKVTDQTGVIID